LSGFSLQRLQLIFKYITKGEGVLDKILWFIATSRNAIVVIICTVIFSILGDPAKVKVIGQIESGLPPFKVPEFKFNDTEGVEYSLGDLLKSDTSALIVLPILAILEHITIAKALAGTDRVDASQGISLALKAFDTAA
jgi:solute carrier family 26 (sodium-independent sulfate anion transporter), member 11